MLDFEDTRDGKGYLSTPKDSSHEKWAQWEDRNYNYFSSRKISHGVTPSYVIIKYTPSTDKGYNRDVQIIHQSSIIGNMFIKDSRKVLNIPKKLILGTDAKTWIKGLKCVRKAIQEPQAHYNGTSDVT